jgi:hypothetical protein
MAQIEGLALHAPERDDTSLSLSPASYGKLIPPLTYALTKNGS